MFVNKGIELLNICNEKNIPIWEYTIMCEIDESGLSRSQIVEKMRKNLDTMREAAEYGLTNETRSISGLIGGDAIKLNRYAQAKNTLTGEFMIKAMARAVSCSEVNATMGKIVAAPTAGSCGIIPAVVITAGEKLNKTEDDLINALFTSAGIGIIIAKNATLSGAEGGCQAECGSAAAMGAAAVVEMMGGTPAMAMDAAAIVIKNILGLVCDPVAGLVEVPCAKRNIAGAVSALTTADLVMSGVTSRIPFDDTVIAMYKVGKQLPCELRETAMGGLATTPTGLKLAKEILSK
ncbi:L-serine ammonia-lyase, iron-sulfur-dependent, subunit alpha [Clostridium estertheticum]|uniref:L-serine ammonia-lyase, iron-sulfur-dependent, subunit alpha n=1 Tax=Clostridium estertheticum TaxID=238834 RepID=UPI00124C81B0|nr:L-serine ammonia-lyase, iron-sulfur-dependent, subunit alpha [Clostridium estertheticum]MBU3073819.1 L-serine ammonia-lyase, iron-sulfur-dependent, subunit alpha [Clostridium estertheticum]MBU3163912.1 L-serine ammonia-lyase, iron-sulfur-dependent, subunit alpha [Clostridium estertheticum]MBZ9615987.1 L-serine ammonia-lyase, iron-sulfur-dependent, subunit alpha [Clostridium estertheticum subsp. laramiense]WAG75855.1 L-serine ammonia-lyase, iron-sulfur-dependent, subunit alpha [Clostridium es